ncbi:MAG: hypothetical protein JWP89_6977 [Schlesneria sp.]|nr:hypothetical protein [Schlesneria sp.]
MVPSALTIATKAGAFGCRVTHQRRNWHFTFLVRPGQGKVFPSLFPVIQAKKFAGREI